MNRTTIITCICIIFPICLLTSGCSKDKEEPQVQKEEYSSAVDISSLPEIELSSTSFFTSSGEESDLLDILEANGVNTIRLRLWVNPDDVHSSFNEVSAFAQHLKSKGFDIWLTLHYSDTWADPGKQEMPEEWKNASFEELKELVFNYTKDVIRQIQPEIVQIGNEINSGFLHPYGHIDRIGQFVELLQEGIKATRETSSSTKIMIHYAGHQGAPWFYNQITELDYDYIGLSYYPIWHGKSLQQLESTIDNIAVATGKKVIIAETAYPFTLQWNDFTNNIVGLDEQLILPDYPATPEGQAAFINKQTDMIKSNSHLIGLCYWGAELVAWKGDQATDASPWENQALFDFENKALPVLQEFDF